MEERDKRDSNTARSKYNFAIGELQFILENEESKNTS